MVLWDEPVHGTSRDSWSPSSRARLGDEPGGRVLARKKFFRRAEENLERTTELGLSVPFSSACKSRSPCRKRFRPRSSASR
jgi:hypothetical protein